MGVKWFVIGHGRGASGDVTIFHLAPSESALQGNHLARDPKTSSNLLLLSVHPLERIEFTSYLGDKMSPGQKVMALLPYENTYSN